LRSYLLLIFLVLNFSLSAQVAKNSGIITGTVLDADNNKPLISATITVTSLSDSSGSYSALSNEGGEFSVSGLPYGYYRLTVRVLGFSKLSLDSIYLREERNDFNIEGIRLSRSASQLETVVVYSEKPLIENKDGKLSFNVSESALSNSSSATELLKQTPLVNVDTDGKLLVKGKEVKVLIDDKPVDMDARQLQELLESMPGSMIEKIEVLTTPPPQFANERGGVINIVTKKGRAGINGRLNMHYGTRGEAGVSGNMGYKKNKFSINFTAGFTYNQYKGNSYSIRKNIYADSSNYFNTTGTNQTITRRPNLRTTLSFDFDKLNNAEIVLGFNQNNNDGRSITEYRNINRYGELYRLSERDVNTDNSSINPSAQLSFTHKTRTPNEVLRAIASVSFNDQLNDRFFYQQYLDAFNGDLYNDSTQLQDTKANNSNVNFRISYDKPLNKKWSFSTGAYSQFYEAGNNLYTAYLRKSDDVIVGNPLLSNDFDFHQRVLSIRGSVRFIPIEQLTLTGGLNKEFTLTWFDLVDNPENYRNEYFSILPFFNLNYKAESGYSITASYRRSVQRPGLNQLNPSIDYSDPYNTRFGNPYLDPYYAENFDLGGGYWSKAFNINTSVGYNLLTDIYSVIRTLQADGKTTVTWQNLSGRKEYEAGFFGGFNAGKKIKVNSSVHYTYNQYSLHDRTENRFRNGGSLNSSLNSNIIFNPLVNATSHFAFHRFANPQGSVRNNVSMSFGVQQKLFKKSLSISLNIVDPFRRQQNRVFTYGPNYELESFNQSNSRNIKIAFAYTFRKTLKSK